MRGMEGGNVCRGIKPNANAYVHPLPRGRAMLPSKILMNQYLFHLFVPCTDISPAQSLNA